MDHSSIGLFHQTLVGTHLADPDLGENILKDLVVVDHIIPTLEKQHWPKHNSGLGCGGMWLGMCYAYSFLALKSTFLTGTRPGWRASMIWHAIAPEAVSSTFWILVPRVSFSHPTMVAWHGMMASSHMPSWTFVRGMLRSLRLMQRSYQVCRPWIKNNGGPSLRYALLCRKKIDRYQNRLQLR